MNCIKKWPVYVGVILFAFHFSLFTSCSEESEEEGEYDNWQARNETMTSQWAADGSLRQIRTYTQNTTSTGTVADYIYVQVLETGAGSESPLYTDTVRVAYRGRLIPTKTYTDGYVFDETYKGDFSWNTAGMYDFVVSGVVNGFGTALMNMHKGDHWRAYMPYQLGYGETVSSSGSIPGYSNLVFDIALLDYWHPGETRPAFKSRKK